MNRGFAHMQIALAVAAVIVLAAAVVALNVYLDRRDARNVAAGRAAALLEVARRDNEQLARAQAEIDRLTAERELVERSHAAQLAKLDQQWTRRVADVEARKERFVGDVVAGRIRLFDHGRKPDDCGAGRARDQAGKADAAASVGDAAGGSELSGPLAQFLGSEASRADAIVLRLTAAQDLLREYLRVCNASDP